MPSTLYPSHSSNLYQTHCHCSNPKIQPSQISPYLNPKKASKTPFPLFLNSLKENPDSKPPWEPIKTPLTLPWVMTTPLVTKPNEIIDTRKTTSRENPRDELTGKLVNRRGKNDTRRIARSIEMLGESRRRSFGDGLVSPFEGSPEEREKMPWETEVGFVVRRMKKERVASAAEMKLERGLLERLRGEAGKMRKWVKVKKAGVTQEVVSYVSSIWKSDELVMLRFDVPLCRNMDRAQEILELKTGGLVVWRRKDTLVIYRGFDYRLSTNTYSKIYTRKTRTDAEPVGRRDSIFGDDGDFDPRKSLYEREADRLLEGLGPRFVDWWMNKPLPVDADLLPEVVRGFRPPARRSLPRTRSQLTDYELTHLRSVARPLPTHFVLGRNRKLQGLAAAILKLWEKCHIAKIALKMGALNTSNKEMAYELKYLTGGVLLLRNKFIILLYRGKDFLPPQVSYLISERESALEKCQIYEENARLEVGETLLVADEPQESAGTAGTLSEFQYIQSEYVDPNIMEKLEMKLPSEAEKEKIQRELKNQERKLSILIRKIERSTAELVKLNGEWRPSELSADQEFITQEERECLRNIGLKMRGVLVLGRRGVFDGVIEGLRQHWKHREVAKVVSMQRLYWRVLHTAKMLEAESGGILISVEKLKHGHAILMYRGKNYRRPIRVNSGNLLTKRQALHRSLEMQRNGSLKFFAYQRQRAISELKRKLENVHAVLEADSIKHGSLE